MASKNKSNRTTDEAPAVDHRVAELKEGINQMESAIKEAAALVATEVGRAAELQRDFEEAVASFEGQLKEAEEILSRKDFALKELEDSLKSQIRVLEDQIREKETLVASRDDELRELRSKFESQVHLLEDQVKEKETLIASRDVELRELRSKFDHLQVSRGPETLRGREEASADQAWKLGEARPSAGGERWDKKIPERRFEAEFKGIKRSLQDIAMRPSGVVKREEGQKRKSLLAALLAPIRRIRGKNHG